jgi:hypothetical protein
MPPKEKLPDDNAFLSLETPYQTFLKVQSPATNFASMIVQDGTQRTLVGWRIAEEQLRSETLRRYRRLGEGQKIASTDYADYTD